MNQKTPRKKLNKHLFSATLAAIFYSCIVWADTSLVFDAILATVNEEPITISDIEVYTEQKISRNLSELKKDPLVNKTLDLLVDKLVLQTEAKKNKVSASSGEVDKYLQMLADKNGMDLDTFFQALKKEKISKKTLEEQANQEILKAKISRLVVSRDIAVTKEEVRKYLKEHPGPSSSGVQVELRQIFLDKTTYAPEELPKIVEQIIKETQQDTNNFAELAKKHSSLADASEGGYLGFLSEKELSSDIFEAIFNLEPGEVSQPVVTTEGWKLFQLMSRLNKQQLSNQTEERIKEQIRNFKIEQALQKFFIKDLYKNYVIERKI